MLGRLNFRTSRWSVCECILSNEASNLAEMARERRSAERSKDQYSAENAANTVTKEDPS